jgi:hypothetical protein
MFHRYLDITEALIFSVFGAESLVSHTFNPAAFEQDAAPLDMGPHKLCCWRLAKCLDYLLRLIIVLVRFADVEKSRDMAIPKLLPDQSR